ncbi:PAS domain-containing protein [Natronorubrum sp. JWXQ-INN-674]|uniref:histidine kinase n=1 Tax=Natronorubrum halalkaliphilum TaxID=2691917 RepID=A0A6B0VSE2_9EURY|nr:PAS domain-containing sensor histidine kinase [Natronorubrum halalkaliphilum]MXV64384.1 PAS domain-containing protein [Natronorubrum halalkaliphilum]
MAPTNSFVGAGFDALPARVAILDGDGEIVYTNQSWESFGTAAGIAPDSGGVGTNYLSVCDGSTDQDGTEAAEGIRAVAAGEREAFSFEYPCHGPSEEGWYMMEATPYTHEQEEYVLVMHVDITERRLLERQARDQAEQMEAFATLLSHDLRNPLAVAMAQSQSLEAAEIDCGSAIGDGTDSVGSTLCSSLERMETIIDDALVLVKTEAVDRPSAVQLTTAVENAWSHVRTDDATLSVVSPMTVHADPSLLGHLLENLFRNAVEHAGEGSAIEIGPLEAQAAAETGTEWAGESTGRPVTDGTGDRSGIEGFYVQDDGAGIPPSDRERIFESGYTTDAGGSGFGLAIVNRVVDAHDWTVSVTDAEDGGARFELRDMIAFDQSRTDRRPPHD